MQTRQKEEPENTTTLPENTTGTSPKGIKEGDIMPEAEHATSSNLSDMR